MDNQILNTPQQLGSFLSSPWQGAQPSAAMFRVCLQRYLLEVLLSPEDTAQNTNHRWFFFFFYLSQDCCVSKYIYSVQLPSGPFFTLHSAPLRGPGLRPFFCSLFL